VEAQAETSNMHKNAARAFVCSSAMFVDFISAISGILHQKLMCGSIECRYAQTKSGF
jgi:hypothetical protein